MSPKTPYNGMLLYHGVGVGKTCTAILTAEAFLELSPKNKVYILAPPAIQPGFYRTIFDINRISFGKEAESPNQHEGCTGNRYLMLTQTQFERDKKDIELRVNRFINKRYSIMGYVAFRNMVNDILKQIPSTLSPEKKRQQETRLLQKALSGCLFIIDEAHNLRDISEVDDDTDATDDLIDNKGDAAGGKKLTPFLRKVLKTCEGNKLLLMSATPMYNTHIEIVSLLNLLLQVDHLDESQFLRESDIQFQMTEQGEQLTPESEAKIIKVANGHVSFMRGENPKAFPARMDPPDSTRIISWPDFAPNGTTKLEVQQEKMDVMRLPLVKCELKGDSLAVIKSMTERLIAAKGIGIRTIDSLLQAGNCIFPGEGLDGRVGNEGFQSWFTSRAITGSFEGTRISTLPQYVPANPAAELTWMISGKNALGKYSPKFNQVIQTIQASTGISFVYSRFVENGAVIFCLLLEANGYTPWGRSVPMFTKGNMDTRQCSKCEKKERSHPAFIGGQEESRENHAFSPAYYALLTASDVDTAEKQGLPLSPNNPRVVTAARDINNADGSKIKVIVGSQVAGEGLDLRSIREVHILEGWFHLSKQEQIIGRGIRYCSHQGLPYKQRNCTIFLYANVFPMDVNKETIDMYSYRKAMNKAVRVGNVSRALKQGAADCNVNRDAILVDGLTEVDMINSQRVPRRVNLNDKDFTSICDWIRCSYQCKPSIDVRALPEDNGTYDIFAARFAEQSMVVRLKKLFKIQVWFRWEDIQEIFKDIPKATLTSLLLRTVSNPSITFENGNRQGHLIYRNNLFIFQPNTIQDHAIPLALRYGRYPIKRDFYEPEGLLVAPKPAIATVKPATVKPATVKPATVKPANTGVKLTYAKKLATAKPPVVNPLEPLKEEGYLATPEEAAAEAVSEEAVPEEAAPEEAAPAATEEAVKLETVNIDLARAVWSQLCIWINAWAKDTATPESIIEDIPNSATNPLSKAILDYFENDSAKKNNIEDRLKKVQWWGKAVARKPEGLKDLRKAAKQFAWDMILKGVDQIALLQEGGENVEDLKAEQEVNSGSITAFRYMDIPRGEPVYVCNKSACPPSILQLFISSKTDPVINARANQTTAAEFYGFMVPWQNSIMFKINEPKPVGKDPGSGAACSIVSTVKIHKTRILNLGAILTRYDSGDTYDLTDSVMLGTRKLTGAPAFCALMEIIMRWMDIRREKYGGLRYFYRPLSAYYSKHKGKK
jgi:hypothetical protein